MFVVAYDPNDKHIVRGLYRVPENVSYEDAETTVQNAYAHNEQDAIEDFLEEKGYESQSFLAAEVS